MDNQNNIYTRIENEISNYYSQRVELSEGVFFSQHKLINRIYKFKNRDLTGSKIKPDLSYDYYADIISPRADSEIKNLRFDTKHILAFSLNPRKDFPAVFIANAQLKSWMAENGEDEKLKAAVEEFTTNGNVGFKRVGGGYELVDPLNTVITNTTAPSIDDTDIIERHKMTAPELKRMTEWKNVDEVIKNCGSRTFTASELTSPIETSTKRYEIWEYTGVVSELEFNQANNLTGGDEHEYFLAKIIVAGLKKGETGHKYTLFAERLPKKDKLSDHYIYAHRGRYEGRFWRVGMYELLFDHQIRANQIVNQLADGLEWSSRVIFRSRDNRILQNLRADIENGEVINTDDLQQVEVRMQGMDQLIADWNRNLQDADRLSNSLEIVRGESMPSGTPFRMGVLMDQNAGRMFVLLRQKISLPYKRVFREWLLPELLKDLKGEDIFRLVGDQNVIDQFRQIVAESWYIDNLVRIGPHTKEMAEAIKAEKVDELRNVDPTIKNSKEIWEDVFPRLFITITGENSDIQDHIQDLINIVGLEQDPDRIAWILDTIYKVRNIPIPPRKEQEPPETQIPERQSLEAQVNEVPEPQLMEQ